jgi:1-acyl-sn-glycerol-3-phosphate acyltransferase
MILLLYKLVEFLVRLSLPLFFSDIVVLGRSFIPSKGPVILIGNHPNMLLDGLVRYKT